MTGYGEAVVETPDFVLGVEVRAVNHRFLKLNARISEEIGYLQGDLEEIVRKRLVRGAVYFTLRFEPTRHSDLYEIDEDLVRKYASAIHKLREEVRTAEEIRIQDLLALPGAVRTEENLVVGKEKVLPAAVEAMEKALGDLVAMRAREGEHLLAEIQLRVRALAELLERVREGAPQALADHFRKLEEKVRKLLGDHQVPLSPEDIIREAAILAERSDISEEIARMESHLVQFSEALEQSDPVGRKLEFIVQEMFRESNTMGSKAPSGALSKHIVEMKAEVDRLKEQVLNIE